MFARHQYLLKRKAIIQPNIPPNIRWSTMVNMCSMSVRFFTKGVYLLCCHLSESTVQLHSPPTIPFHHSHSNVSDVFFFFSFVQNSWVFFLKSVGKLSIVELSLSRKCRHLSNGYFDHMDTQNWPIRTQFSVSSEDLTGSKSICEFRWVGKLSCWQLIRLTKVQDPPIFSSQCQRHFRFRPVSVKFITTVTREEKTEKQTKTKAFPRWTLV